MAELMDRIPPHIRYPGMVVLLLSGTVISQVILFRSATQGRGLQVEQDYYARAVDWDRHVASEQASRALGWEVNVAVAPDRQAAAPNLRHLDLTLHDADGKPLTDVTGTVRMRRPELATEAPPIPLVAQPDRPGVYRITTTLPRPGVFDLSLDLRRAADHYTRQQRHTIK